MDKINYLWNSGIQIGDKMISWMEILRVVVPLGILFFVLIMIYFLLIRDTVRYSRQSRNVEVRRESNNTLQSQTRHKESVKREVKNKRI